MVRAVVVVPEAEAQAVQVEASTALAVRPEETSAGPCFLPPVRDPPRVGPRQTITKMSLPEPARIPRSIRRLRPHRVPVRLVPARKM